MATQDERTSYVAVWDRATRIFHWVNALCVIALIALGLFIWNAKAFGVSGDGKVLLKTVHVYVGYVFALNLLWRFVWAFVGNRHARWRAILPGGKGYVQALRAYVSGFMTGNPPRYLGHSPLARIFVTLLLGLMLTQASSGLVLAGTDLYMPPFGHAIAKWVTGPDADPAALDRLRPGSKEEVDEALYAEMRAFRKPVITLHQYVFYTLLAMIVLHILGVVMAELRERSGLVSAMITGKKRIDRKPEDEQ